MSEYYQGPNNSAQLKAVTLVLPIVATLLVGWRISWRAKKNVIVLSDYLLILGLCLSLCLAGFNLDPYFRWGYGYHKADLPPEIQNATTPKICFWLNQIFFKATAGVVKLSICSIYVSIFKDPILLSIRIARQCTFAIICIVTVYYTAGCLVSTFQCNPVRKAWNKDVMGVCIDNDRFRVANAYINVMTSVLLVILPYPVLLATSQRKETWQFLGLIAIGLLHTACAASRVILLYVPNPGAGTDPHWFNTTPNTLAMSEIFTAVIVATIMTMRPCFQAFARSIATVATELSHSRLRLTRLTNTEVDTSAGNSETQNQGSNCIGFNEGSIHTFEEPIKIELLSREYSTEKLVIPTTNKHV